MVWSYHKFLSRYYRNCHRVYLPRGRCCPYTDSETLHFTHRDNSSVRAPAFQVQKQDKTGLMIRNDTDEARKALHEKWRRILSISFLFLQYLSLDNYVL